VICKIKIIEMETKVASDDKLFVANSGSNRKDRIKFIN